MGTDHRTINLGRRVQLEEKIKCLTLRIHSEVQSLKDLFEPRTVDLSYVKDIDPERLRVFSSDISRDKKKLDVLVKELEALERELGIEES